MASAEPLTDGAGSGKVLWHVSVSLDGFIAGPDDSVDWMAMDWLPEAGGPSAMGQEIIRTTGAIVAGRRWYDLAATRLGGIEGIYGGAWQGLVFVLTHRPPSKPPGPRVAFVTDLPAAIATALEAAGGKNVVLFGATIPRQSLELGLVDEVAVHLVPVLLGDGVRLYGEPAAGRIDLKPISIGESGHVLDLRFEIAVR